jgi:16S rRNA (guanine527-N7)-methyltransferase
MNLSVELQQQLAKLDLSVDASNLEQLLALHEQLLHWNRTYNLTAITDPLEAVEKHLVDSLTLLPYLGQAETLIDIGSGAGFPAIPLKIMRPDLQVISVDSVAKKISFQKHVVRKLQLQNFMAWHGRAEELSQQSFLADKADLVVARAFSSLPKLLDLALPCLKPDGRVIAMKGPEGEDELRAIEGRLKNTGIECRERIHLTLPVSGSVRQLLFFGR